MKELEAGGGTPQAIEAQYAALCYRPSGRDTHEVLLITSRDTGRWIIPKGWPMKGRSGAESALREAFEEAGVEGRLSSTPIGVYSYDKILPDGVRPCIVTVYPVEVTQLSKDFPEKGQRARKWFTPRKAAEKVNEPELRALIETFDPHAAGAAGRA
jgi:8-oxo-dGTP pyrophosphatase MutT (NUDIX family)